MTEAETGFCSGYGNLQSGRTGRRLHYRMSNELVCEIVLLPKSMAAPACSGPQGRVPRITKLMALAIKLEGLIHRRVLRDYTDVAMLGKISKARATQLMNLLNLAPDIQESLLLLPNATTPRDRVTERQLRQIVKVVDWEEQRKLFGILFPDYALPLPAGVLPILIGAEANEIGHPECAERACVRPGAE